MKKAFIWYGKTWYAQSPNQPKRRWYDEVSITLTDENGWVYEVPFRWYMLGNKKPAIRLEVFSGCMECLEHIKDAISLADREHYPPTPSVFCENLKRWGYENKTEYERKEL